MLQFEERAEWIGKMKDSDTIRKPGSEEKERRLSQRARRSQSEKESVHHQKKGCRG